LDHINTADISPLLHYYRGRAYQLIGDVASAKTEYEVALAAGENVYFRNALNALLGQ
jgi:hypothetical protein